MSKINYSINKDDKNYIMLDARYSLTLIAVLDDTPSEVSDEAMKIFNQKIKYDSKHINKVEEISISKDNILGRYITSRKDKFRNDSDYISYEKVVNSLNIAMFEDNIKIMPLFKERIEGEKEKLNIYSENTIEYILENDNFKDYLDRLDGKEAEKEYYVYENDEIHKKSLEIKKGKVYTKK